MQDAPSLPPSTEPPLSVDAPKRAALLIPSRSRSRARIRPYGRKFGYAVFATLSGALAFSLLTDGGRQTRSVGSLLPAEDLVLYSLGLRIDQVALKGQRFTSDQDIFDSINLANAATLLNFDAAATRARIEELPWVASARISRVFPGTLDIRIAERKPAALWRSRGTDYLIDETGRVLSAVAPGPRPALPRVSGEGAPAAAKAIIELVARYPAIAARFDVAERVGGRRWTLHLKDRVTVHLAADQEASAFSALTSDAELGGVLKAHDLIVDLRTRGRISVRPALGTDQAPDSGQVQARS